MSALFRDIRERMKGRWPPHFGARGRYVRWAAVSLGALLIAFLAVLYFLDWNQLRGPLVRYASAKLGREVRIDGDLKVDLFRWQPRVFVGKLHVGNPAWVGRPASMDAKQVRVEFRLWPALFGDWIFPVVEIDQPDFLLVRDADGRTNWDRAHSGTAPGWQIPPIQHFVVIDGRVEIDDAIRKIKFLGSVSSREVAPPEPGRGKEDVNAFQITGDGMLNGNKFLADIHGGPLINVAPGKPYAFVADIHSGATHVVIDGSIAQPFHLDKLTAHVDVSGDTLSNLYDLFGLVLPGTPPYRLAISLRRDGDSFTLADIAGTIGSSDLRGNLTIDTSGSIPDLRGSLSSRVLDLRDLGGLLRGGKASSGSGAYLIPDVTLHTERLRDINGEVDYAARSIRSSDFPLRGLATHISVQNGVLTLKPLAVSFNQGKISGSVSIDGRKDVPITSVDARVTDIHIENFIGGDNKAIEGIMEARAALSGTGASVHKAAATAKGTFTVVIPSGQIRHSLAEWLGVNVISALGLTLSGDTANTGIRCAVAHFSVRNGVLTTQQLVFDTDPVRVDGHGTVDLNNETMDLTMAGKPKSFQLVRLRAPVTITGKLNSPTLGVNAGTAVAQGAIGTGLGLIFPPAALLAFIDPGLAKNADCTELLKAAQKQGAPLRPSTIKNAPGAKPH